MDEFQKGYLSQTVFPCALFSKNGTPAGESMGMSIRDHFAGQALMGLLTGRPDADCGPHGYAQDAYIFADAMLEARKK